MTMVIQRLLALEPQDHLEQWPARYGDDWQDHANVVVRELQETPGWMRIQDRFRDRPSHQLDWGATAWEVTLDEIKELIGPGRARSGPHSKILRSLDAKGRYALVSIEMY